MNEVNKKSMMNLALAMMFGAQMASNHLFQDKQPPRPSKTPNNNLRLKAEAKRQRKMERNKAAL